MMTRFRLSRPVLILAVVGALIALAAAGYLVAGRLDTPTWEEQEQARTDRRKKDVYARETTVTEQLFQRMGEPEPGEWLYHFTERGQTAEEYARDAHNRKSAERHTIYLVPLAPLSEAQRRCLPTMVDYGQAFFGCTTRLLPEQELPGEAYAAERKQYDAGQVLRWLEPQVPDDALVLAAITGADLYHGDLHFVFGVGSRRNRTGLYSLHRYGAEAPTLLRRALKVMNHELGHIFSLPHCIFYRCSMNGSNSLVESDARPIHYCPECLAKLQAAVAFDTQKRFDALAAFYRRVGYEADAAFVEKRARLLAAASQGR